MNYDSFVMLVRQVVMSGGAFAAGRGWISADNVTLWVGVAVAAAPLLWGQYVRWNTKSVPAATAARPDVPTVSQITGATKL